MIALYLVIDGGRTYRWILAFFPPLTRRKIHHTSEEVSKVIFNYIVGQAITSALVMVFTFSVLSLLHAPGALMRAIIAAFFDVLPMLGFFLLTAPEFLMALSASLKTALIVLALYVLYGALESNFIVPKVYGKSLRLSTLSVLLGLLVGTLLAGLPGALAALPLVASYSVIERIWLKHYLGEGDSEKHELQKEKKFGEKS
jgi:predicted PurR-regulated permease PerM